MTKMGIIRSNHTKGETSVNLTVDQLAIIDKQLLDGNLVAAVRELRQFTGVQLAEAKIFVDDRLAYLRMTRPSQFQTAQKASPLPQPWVLQQIKPLPDEALREFRALLSHIDATLCGLNYVTTLSVHAATVPASDLPIPELMMTFFPKSTPFEAKIRSAQPDELVEYVTECFRYVGGGSAGPQLIDALLSEYWRHLNLLVPLETSTLYYYGSDVGLPGHYILWRFAYLLHDSKTNRCVVITGNSTD